MTGALVGVAVFLVLIAIRPQSLSDRVGRALSRQDVVASREGRRLALSPGAAVGFGVGVVLGPGSPVVAGLVGAGAGHIAVSLRRSARLRHRSRRLGQELPTVADMCALYVLSGESVVTAMRRFVDGARGVAAEEMAGILAAVDAGAGFPEAARDAARQSAHRDAARLYEMLAQAHRSGARLVDSLEMFAADRRAALERELTVEGGRRAITGYGPILGLMIPTTLVFLMYPTLAGLEALSTTR